MTTNHITETAPKPAAATKILSFKATKEEHEAMSRCAARARKLNPEYDHVTCVMDLNACHSNGHPLDFVKLEAFPDFDFAHDVFGIANHINRKTGHLERFFSPRCSAPATSAA